MEKTKLNQKGGLSPGFGFFHNCSPVPAYISTLWMMEHLWMSRLDFQIQNFKKYVLTLTVSEYLNEKNLLDTETDAWCLWFVFRLLTLFNNMLKDFTEIVCTLHV